MDGLDGHDGHFGYNGLDILDIIDGHDGQSEGIFITSIDYFDLVITMETGVLNIPTPIKMTHCPPRLQTLCMRGILKS